MDVIIRPDAAAAAELTARLIADALRARPDLVLGLATGRTMAPVYDRLAAWHRSEGLDFSRCRTFNLDEYIGLPAGHPQSFRHTMETQLFRRVNLRPEHAHLPDGSAEDLRGAARDYEAEVARAGGIDLQLLGIGSTGHIGFNEPLSALRSRTREKALAPATRRQNAAAFGGDPDQVPSRAITMGVGTILEARRIVLLATGEAKAEILARAVEGPITAMISATALQLHPACTVIADEAAAARLTGQEHYRWQFEHEPEWAPYREESR